MSDTDYIETEALLRAMADAEADSGNVDTTVDYLVETFLPGELRHLRKAAGLLYDACTEARKRQAADMVKP